MVHAPAGFGKTTVLAQARQHLCAQGIATAWLTLDLADNDPSRFLACLQAEFIALQTQEIENAALTSDTPDGDQVSGLFERIAAIDFPFVLFLDEFEVINSPGVLDLVGQVLERLPSSGRIILGTRTMPQLRLARLRATGQMRELDAQNLRFSLEETRAFFETRPGIGLSDDDLRILHKKTEGWVAALLLASLALERNKRGSEFIASFSGTESALANYLAEEVLSQQPEPVRHFLLRTSILGEISAPLCSALMPEVDCHAILAELAATDVFIIQIEGEPGTWRYHSLFASFLRSELKREAPLEFLALHEAAAHAFLKQGRTVPAIDHLIAGGHTQPAVTLLRNQALQLLTQGRLQLLARWFDALPPSALVGSPLLEVTYAWTLGYTRGPQAAIVLLKATGLTDSNDPEIRVHVAALQATLLIMMDRWEDAYAAGRRSLAALPSPSAYADTALVNVLAAAATVLGLFDESRHLVERARLSQGQSVSYFHRMYSESIEGIIDLLEGRFRQAQARFHLALQTSQAPSIYSGHGNAWAGLLYAVSIYENGDLREAQHLLHLYLPLARDAWLPEQTILGYLLLSRTTFYAGEIDHTFEHISELEYLGHERRIPRFVEAARLERAWVLLRQGHSSAAAKELAIAAESPVWRDVGARQHLALDWDNLDIACARWELIAGDANKALENLSQLLSQARMQGRSRRALKLRLLLAMAQARTGQDEKATESTLALVRECCTERVVRLFVDEGPTAAALLMRCRPFAEAQHDPLITDYLHRLITAFGPQAIPLDADATVGGDLPELKEALTTKEILVLQLLAEGYSNKALTEKLFVSDSTVRTHLRNINAKLGANNRTQAVALGRRYGLINFR
ncbi:LuxR C-terminal-related transcriptional regulator [Marinobacter sp. 71-i]|uniref:LuxR C-terminal-related transcriptional regulator n=1 Tax=Marinobacter iranensis TaxID=2962607 RepID=A0ABT5YBB2_9GAMM|nr:LuxR C-terminal-related transcriptional regulator [Marinobacter iranensis]MDF0750836.1 LuxR C-terminal-related transcriptional regulator [Marinobacter iranensis]